MGLLAASATLAGGQGLPNGGAQFQQNIQIPGWATTGARGNANVDVMGFNPVTRLMYLADRTNHGVDVIDTHTNVVVALLRMRPDSVPNVPLVAVNLQQLVVTDGGPSGSVFVWDLRTGGPATIYVVDGNPSACSAANVCLDGADYDPINQTVYVINDEAPYFLTGINLAYQTITTKTPLPWSADLIKFNPVDGKIYVALEDADNNNAGAGIAVFDPANPTAPLGHFTIGAACPGHGIDIDPISNIAVMGCFGGTGDTGDVAVNLATGALIKTFTDVGGTDTVVFNPNVRRFYAAAGLNAATTSGCPKGTGTFTPILGIMDATGSGGAATLDGVVCTGGGHIAGVDPITNLVYVPVSQYPADPASGTTGVNGVLVVRDSTPPAQAPVSTASATLKGTGTSAATGTVSMTLVGRRIRVTASPTSLPSGSVAAWLTVPTTLTNEWLACAVNPANLSAICGEDLLGDPLIGATVTLSVDSGQGGTAAARGTITGH